MEAPCVGVDGDALASESELKSWNEVESSSSGGAARRPSSWLLPPIPLRGGSNVGVGEVSSEGSIL